MHLECLKGAKNKFYVVFGSKGGYLVENHGFLSKFDINFTIYPPLQPNNTKILSLPPFMPSRVTLGCLPSILSPENTLKGDFWLILCPKKCEKFHKIP